MDADKRRSGAAGSQRHAAIFPLIGDFRNLEPLSQAWIFDKLVFRQARQEILTLSLPKGAKPLIPSDLAYQTLPSRYLRGSTARLPRRSSKWSCGSLTLPVLPTLAITWRFLTLSPRLTSNVWLWA